MTIHSNHRTAFGERSPLNRVFTSWAVRGFRSSLTLPGEREVLRGRVATEGLESTGSIPGSQLGSGVPVNDAGAGMETGI